MTTEDILEILNVVDEFIRTDPSALNGNVITQRRFKAFLALARASLQNAPIN
jgi:hypothetical protein